MIPAFLFNGTVIIERYEGQSGTGGPIYSAPTLYPAYIEEQARLIMADDGNQRVVATVVSLNPDVPPIPAESKVTWSLSGGGGSGRVERAKGYEHASAPSHRELEVV